MAAPRPDSARGVVRQRLAGVAFLVVVALLMSLSIAIYNKAFVDVVTVTLQADRAGNQLSNRADVKVRGLIVGEVREIDADVDGATLTLALQPSKVGLIPANVQAQLLPKTLFGEKFVKLVLPEDPSPERISEGDVISMDRSSTAIETARVVDDLLPLLKALDAEQLTSTLNAISTALRGRGDQLGENLVLLRDYLAQLNPSLPTIQQDLRGLADFADTLDAAAPDLLAVLDNLSFSSRALQDTEAQLTDFLTSTTVLSASADSLLRQNEQRLITLARESLPGLDLFADYAPGYACLLQGLDRYDEIVGTTFGGGQPGLHITLEVTRDGGAFVAGDEPAYLDDSPPRCFGNPLDQPVPAPDQEFDDGFQDEAREGIGLSAVRQSPASQRRMIAGLAAPVLGVGVDEVPDLATLMMVPLARGATMGLAPGEAP